MKLLDAVKHARQLQGMFEATKDLREVLECALENEVSASSSASMKKEIVLLKAKRAQLTADNSNLEASLAAGKKGMEQEFAAMRKQNSREQEMVLGRFQKEKKQALEAAAATESEINVRLRDLRVVEANENEKVEAARAAVAKITARLNG